MSEFIHRMDFGAPLAMQSAANDLFMLIGYGPGDQRTFVIKKGEDGSDDPHLDADGNPYCLASGRFMPEFIERLTADLDLYEIPEWCYDGETLLIDMDAAKAAQASMQLIPEEGTPAPMNVVPSDALLVRVSNLQPEEVTPYMELGPFQAETTVGAIPFFLRHHDGVYEIGFDFDPDSYPDFWLALGNLADDTGIGKELYDAAVIKAVRYLP